MEARTYAFHSRRFSDASVLLPGPLDDPRLVVVADADPERAAPYRVLRFKLARRGDPRVIVVSSARAGDGATTCAANLALALAEQRSSRVLLAEASKSEPQLAALFGFDPPESVDTRFTGVPRERALRWWVVNLQPLGIDVASMRAGSDSDNALEGPTFAAAVKWLREVSYDYVVVDAPPVLGSAAVNYLQEAADGTVLVTRARRSRGRDVRAAIEQIGAGSVIGIVLVED